MLKVRLMFMRERIYPWDAKLDNLGIAQRGLHGKWAMCHLDGLHYQAEESQHKTLGMETHHFEHGYVRSQLHQYELAHAVL